ncbi:MAG: hypothetical protein SFU87_20360 [Chitinophagaceae bacterium]|nr:hypothetical protein [Chitinophagaceae bacterium]
MKRMIPLLLLSFSLFYSVCISAQEDAEERKGFKKENLFTGGSISLSFFNNTFLVGASPVFGYSLTKWADIGIVTNINYSSARDYQVFNDRLRQTIYGGGLFTRLYPVRFLFAQAQFEHNFIRLKYVLPNNGGSSTSNTSENSFLVGGGYTSGRFPGSGQGFFYLAVLFDVSGNRNSPYTDGAGRVIPIIRGGVQVPLFQGRRGE